MTERKLIIESTTIDKVVYDNKYKQSITGRIKINFISCGDFSYLIEEDGKSVDMFKLIDYLSKLKEI